MYQFLDMLKEKIDVGAIIIIILTGIISVIYDGRRYKSRNQNKEYRIIKAIAYSYITIGLILLVLLRD